MSDLVVSARGDFKKIKVASTTNCWEWSGAKTRAGYGLLSINSKLLYVHRISYRIFHGKIVGKNMIMHSCDNPKCFNPEHLSQGSAKDNVQDMWMKGRHKTNTSLFFSDDNPKKKFKAEELERIARERIMGARAIDVCRKYGISKTYLRDTVKKITGRMSFGGKE